ncbi:MAG: FeoB-associated Cys-rich membrane protein [Acidobacteria bacterium]|nr:FeoB-associated Cys-rich membrane protein [Acidobacteriota bacterium]
MSVQTLIVVLIVLGAVGYVLLTVRRQIAGSRPKKDGCGDDCGCGK